MRHGLRLTIADILQHSALTTSPRLMWIVKLAQPQPPQNEEMAHWINKFLKINQMKGTQ
jgi:hypothetical protein